MIVAVIKIDGFFWEIHKDRKQIRINELMKIFLTKYIQEYLV
jgi:hypothetical protein